MIVKEIVDGSIASELGIKANDRIISINGEPLNDILEYWFRSETETLIIEIESENEIWEAEIAKDIDEDLGIIFENDLNNIVRCKNNCIFCFVNQLPKGLRHSLYIKDDDFRLSFLSGSYITLTNLSDENLERIIKQKISPIYVSVHTVDDRLRREMLGCEYSGEIMEQLKYLIDNGIEINTQIVLCPAINDEQKLVQSIAKLSTLYPGVRSLAVVPVGLTQYRRNSADLQPVKKMEALKALNIIRDFQKKCFLESGTRFVWGSDELYIKAQREIPCPAFYEDFIQLENGVGMVAKFVGEAESALKSLKNAEKINKKIAIATGADFYPFMSKIAQDASIKLGSEINVYSVKNEFFGGGVTVTGLLTGYDYIKALKGRLTEDILLLSQDCFKADQDVLLDDVTLDQLSEELDIECRIVSDDGFSLINSIATS